MKSTFEEMGGTYRRVGDYYLPNIAVPEEHYTIGKYGRMHHRYLKEHREVLYNILVLNGTLFRHLREIDTAANERMELLIRQMAERQGVNEELKHRDQMGWVRAMNTSAIPRHEAGCWLPASRLRGGDCPGRGGLHMNKDAIHDLQMLVWNSSNAFADMRLMVEGAITLYEDDAESICSLTLDQTDKHAAIAYDTIGTALYGLREKIRDMQTEYMTFSAKPPTPPAVTA